MIKQQKDDRRVMVTGLGVVSSIGIGWQEFWPNLLAGKSGISKITSFDTSSYDRHYGGEIKNFNPYQFIDRRKADRMGRASQMAIAAAKMALDDAGIDKKMLSRERVGVVVGTTMGEPQILEFLNNKFINKQVNDIEQKFVITYPTNIISSNIGNYFQIANHNLVFATACAAGNHSIGYASDLIRKGDSDVMLAGGADCFSLVAFTGFSRLLAMSPDKCQPFDLNRKGMLLGEGAGIVILESFSRAVSRRARIYAEILDYGSSNDAFHATTPDPLGIEKTISLALKATSLKPYDVSYISAHGTGTRENDRSESKGIENIFKDDLKRIPVSSIKSMLGHSLGAASAIELISCCLSIKDSKVPPTINFQNKDPECCVDCVPNVAREHKVKIVLNNSFAFGGNNIVVVLRKPN